MNREAERGPKDDGEDDGWHIFHKSDGADTHSHRARTEYHAEFGLEIGAEMFTQHASEDASDDNSGYIDDDSDWHMCPSCCGSCGD